MTQTSASILSSPARTSLFLSETFQIEIVQTFSLFDEHRTGCISLPRLKLLIRSLLGLRITQPQLIPHVYHAKKRRLVRMRHDARQRQRQLQMMKGMGHEAREIVDIDENIEVDADEIDMDIDLELVLDIMSQPYFNRESNENISNYDPHVEMKVNFRLFDNENKGYIDSKDVKRVVSEINDYRRKEKAKSVHARGNDIDNEDDDSDDGFYDLNEVYIRAMIDEFDGDQDSVINFREFKKMMES